MIMHSRFSEFNDNAETLSYVTVDDGTCVTTFAINDNDVSAGKSNTKCHSIYLCRFSLRFGNLRRENRLLKETLNET